MKRGIRHPPKSRAIAESRRGCRTCPTDAGSSPRPSVTSASHPERTPSPDEEPIPPAGPRHVCRPSVPVVGAAPRVPIPKDDGPCRPLTHPPNRMTAAPLPTTPRTGPAVLRSLHNRTTRLPRVTSAVPRLTASHVPARGEAPSRRFSFHATEQLRCCQRVGDKVLACRRPSLC